MNNMGGRFENNVVVITGGSSGLGACLAKRFADEGANVVVTARSSDKLRQLAETIGPACTWMVMDVTSTESVHAAVDQILARFGRVDVWINNAGYGVFAKLADIDLDEMARMMDVNYMGTVRCTKAILPHMLKAGKGKIVNIASMAGKIGSAKSTGYSATKHAVLGFTNSLRHELYGTGVSVLAVNPGPIDTPFFDRADPTGQYVRNVRRFMLRPEQVARVVVKAVAKDKQEINLPWILAAGTKLVQLFPALLDKLAWRLLSRK